MNTDTNRRALRSTAPAIVAAALAVSALAGGARGQNALDGNLRDGSGGWNSPQVLEDYRARNLLVTGDVPGGRGFRGVVGYTAAGDFGGELGADDLFGFRAQSAFSAPGFVGAGRTAERLRFGEALGSLSYRRNTAALPLARDRMAVPSEQLYLGAPTLLDQQISVDRLIHSASSPELIDSAAQPLLIGVARNQEGRPMMIDASSLRGIKVAPIDLEGPRFDGLSVFDMMRVREDQEAGVETAPPGTPFRMDFQPSGERDRMANDPEAMLVEPASTTTLVEATASPDYARILERIRTRFSESSDVVLSLDQALVSRLNEELDENFDALRRRLIGAAPGPETSAVAARPGAPGAGVVRPAPPVAPVPSAGAATVPPGPVRTPETPEAEDEKGGIEKFGIVLRHGERLEHLANEDPGRFNELMRSAEDRLRRGEYFYAEQHFLRALRFVPGHPLATAGLAHAQIGAGLHGSASLTLRSLLTHQPEMIDVRYEQGLLPPRVNMMKAVDELRFGPQLIEDDAARGFMIAYLGHQLDDRDLVVQGLGLMTEANAGDPLLALLRKVWGREESGK